MTNKESINYYSILGLESSISDDPNFKEILTTAYRNKAKKCHPDKNKGNATLDELFLLLTEGYELLIDEDKRKDYNIKLYGSKTSYVDDFNNLKIKAKQYYDELNEKISNMPKVEFKLSDDDIIKSETISVSDIQTNLDEYTKSRDDQDVECNRIKIFNNDEEFNNNVFNSIFMKLNSKKNTSLVKRDDYPDNTFSASDFKYSSYDDIDTFDDNMNKGESLDRYFNYNDDITQEDINNIIKDKKDKNDNNEFYVTDQLPEKYTNKSDDENIEFLKQSLIKRELENKELENNTLFYNLEDLEDSERIIQLIE